MDRLIAKVDRITEKINHASYGYAGFFDVIKVKEENLDRMIDFDNKLVGEVEDLAVEVDTFKTEVRRGETKKAKERIQTITEKVEIFEDNFDKRGEIILGVR
jgi:uncharacterized protein Yka (UPF0111/DUF47 family)